ncbi:hypothetical protein [Aureliella helgolandensis]|uniref:Uncharacterized protein n=1 Tax=Aureliella helgolandensis TaxID=2527968 RepID=A0A518G7N2_9BACT|nr:hypothetical protein [Aureliella helgolandensis]QDV24582.1 hypothetical protein Q31a_29020 [Aureliella helgolandensis]
MNKEINVLAMVKGEERYVFLYDDKNRIETLRMLGRYAADPALSFSWYDAAVMSKKIREMGAEDDRLNEQIREKYNTRFSYRHEEDMI